MDADRNLIFGVLALQAELIDAAQFVEACLVWTARKHQHLADVLIERGWIEPADRGHLDYLLQRKLGKHGGDMRASLAAIPEDVKRSLAALEDGDIQQSLANLPASVDAGVTVSQAPAAAEHYCRLRLHATGGIGRVWLARDNHLGREVALKELRPERAGQGNTAARFLQEAQITGQLEHPGVIPVYELVQGPDGGQAFYTMRFVKGRTLSQAVRAFHETRLAGREDPHAFPALLSAFATVCNTVAYAHARGVIHRDLKGHNVVLGDFGEVVVLDWGLAKLVGRPAGAPDDASVIVGAAGTDSGYTIQGQALGTPAYMAPEQSAGSLELIDHRTDVYGLGAILYEILTGTPPFTGGSTEEVLRKVREEAPAPPRSMWPEAPPALEAVCRRALAKEPSDRPASAAELAQVVQGWQEMQRRQAEEALRRQTQILQSILNSIQEGVFVTDKDGRWLLCNPAAEAVCGPRDGRGRRPQPVSLRAAVQGSHRAAAAPVCHRPPRRASQGTAASRDRGFPGGDRPARRLLGPEPVLQPLQAPGRRHPGTIPQVRKNRIRVGKPLQERGSQPLYHSVRFGARVPEHRRCRRPVGPTGSQRLNS
jgi:serine/threonine protein kinase